MRKKRMIGFILLSSSIVCLSISGHALDAHVITLVTSEQEPYVGEGLENNGYVHELVTEAFTRAGYEVVIEFLPLARATAFAKRGTVDGILPYYYTQCETEYFVFSEPFQGTSIRLLKKSSLEVSLSEDLRTNPEEALRELNDYIFGVRLGATITPAFDNAYFLEKDTARTDFLNILKLAGDRIDFVVIDKFTAADIIVQEAPHLIGELDLVDQPLATNDFHVAFSRNSAGYKQRLRDFNHSFETMVQDGTYEEILSRHGFYLLDETDSDTITLTIGTVDNEDMHIMQRLSEEYVKRNPHIEFEWRVLDENILRLRLLSDLAISDGQFDIMTIGAYETPIWAERNWLRPFLHIPESYDVYDILRSVRESLSYDGTLYALPFYGESSMLYYREDVFENAGIRMPENPTYEDVLEFAALIHDPENGLYGIGLRGTPGWGANMAYLNTLVNTSGGRWFDMDWNPTINTPEWEEALHIYTELVSYGPPNITANNYNENKELFANAQLGMWIDATVAAGILYDPRQSEVADVVGFAQAPTAATDKGASWLWTWSLAVPSSSTQSEEAAAFIRWATSKEYIALVGEKEGWLAVPPGTRVSTYENEQYQAVAPFADFVLRAIETADPTDATVQPVPYTGVQFVTIPEYSSLGTRVGLQIANMVDGEITIEEALKNSQALVEEQMRRSGYIK